MTCDFGYIHLQYMGLYTRFDPGKKRETSLAWWECSKRKKTCKGKRDNFCFILWHCIQISNQIVLTWVLHLYSSCGMGYFHGALDLMNPQTIRYEPRGLAECWRAINLTNLERSERPNLCSSATFKIWCSLVKLTTSSTAIHFKNLWLVSITSSHWGDVTCSTIGLG